MYSPTTDCAIRDRLASRYKRLLEQHTAALLEVMTADKGGADAQALYDSCVEAREALEQHDQNHKCLGVQVARAG
jgi:hypothetical protein